MYFIWWAQNKECIFICVRTKINGAFYTVRNKIDGAHHIKWTFCCGAHHIKSGQINKAKNKQDLLLNLVNLYFLLILILSKKCHCLRYLKLFAWFFYCCESTPLPSGVVKLSYLRKPFNFRLSWSCPAPRSPLTIPFIWVLSLLPAFGGMFGWRA